MALLRRTRLLVLLRGSSLRTGAGGFQQLRGLQTATLPDLPYDYGDLEPVIDAETMKLHHQKHHQTYVTNYNRALEHLDDAMSKGDDAPTILQLQSSINFNGGGTHFSLSLFFYYVRSLFLQ